MRFLGCLQEAKIAFSIYNMYDMKEPDDMKEPAHRISCANLQGGPGGSFGKEEPGNPAA